MNQAALGFVVVAENTIEQLPRGGATSPMVPGARELIFVGA